MSEDTQYGWVWVRVGDICDSVNGRAFKPSEWLDSGTPIIRIQNLKDPASQFNYFQGEAESRFQVEYGDLLFAWSGTPGTSFGAHIWHGLPGLLNQHIFNVRFNRTLIDPRYFRDALNQNVSEYVRQAQGGVGLAHITKPKFNDSLIPLPPLPEQHRIVAEIEKHFTRLDASVDALKRAQANLKRYRASLLKVACEGRLVPTEAELARSEDRDYEPADRLLERILVERRARWESQPKHRGKYREPAPPDTPDLPELPEGWVWASVEHLSYLVQYGTSAKASSSSVGTPVLRMGNIQDGKLDFSNLKYLPNGNPEVKKTLLNPGDLLFNRTNSAELVGKSTVFKGELPAVCFASYLIRVSFDDSYLSDFACTYINSEHGRNFIRSVVSQQVGQANVNGTKLSSMPIPLPPLAEQHRIVAEVERQMSVIQQAEAAVDASLKGSDRLRQSILKQAFSGQLVPQDPNDEPASVLLERIRAEREASQAKPKRPAPRRPLPDTPSRHDISSFPVLSSPVMLQSAWL